MHTNSKFIGTGVALVTPFKKDKSIDKKSIVRIVNHIIEGGAEYIVVLGTTGESVTLTKEEKQHVVSLVIQTVNKRVPIVMGLGGNNTQEIINAMNHPSDFKGIDALLSVSPYYNKPNQEGIYQHYKALAKVSRLPIILYNVPGRTGSNISAETTLRLAREFKNIIGIKEASGNLEQAMKIIKNKPSSFKVISGDDSLTLPMIACGAEGVISVVANAFPKDFSEMVRQTLAGNLPKARTLHYKLTDITEQLFADGNPGGIKAALEILDLCKAYVRLPLMPINAETRKKLEHLIAQY